MPTDKPEKEPILITQSSDKHYFGRPLPPPPGEIFAKYPAGNRWSDKIIGNFFYDVQEEREGKFPWSMPYNAPETIDNVVFRDTDLDTRLYYDEITIPKNLGDVRVRVLDASGADLQPTTLNANSSERTIKFDKNRVQNAKELRVELLSPFTKGTSGAIYLTTKLKDPSAKILTSSKDSPVFENTLRFVVDGKERGAARAQKRALEVPKPTIAAFKTFIGLTNDGETRTELITGDRIRYRVGFTPRSAVFDDMNNIKVIDLLPKDIDVVNVELDPDFAAISGAKYEVVENYNNTGQAAVIFTAKHAEPGIFKEDIDFPVGYIYAKTNVALPNKQIKNDVYVRADNTKLDLKVNDPIVGKGEWSHTNVWTNYTAGSIMEARKQVRSYDENGKPTFWRESVATLPGEKLDYKLRVTNGTDKPRTNLVIYDVFPHVGDMGIPTPRESEFENVYDTSRKPIIPEGYTIQYYNGTSFPKYDGTSQSHVDKVLSSLKWENTPTEKNKGYTYSCERWHGGSL